MKLRIDVEAYSRRLAAPLETARGTLAERAGFLLKLSDPDGCEGWGEAAPVYWIDDDPLDAVREFLLRVVGEVEIEAFESSIDVSGLFAALRAQAGEPRPAARAAVETAALDLIARREGVAVVTLLGGSPDTPVAVNALVSSSDPAEVDRLVRTHLDRGVRAVKLKVGAPDVSVDIERVSAAIAATSGRARLRLDANRAWTFTAAERVLRAVDPRAIDYIEEPLEHPTTEELARLRGATGVAIGVDESLELLGGIEPLAAAAACDVVVLKPARVGGPLRTLALARSALASGLRAVLTDSIETEIGRAAVVHTAAAVGGAPEAVGLGGRGLLDNEPIAPSICPAGPGLTVRHELPS